MPQKLNITGLLGSKRLGIANKLLNILFLLKFLPKKPICTLTRRKRMKSLILIGICLTAAACSSGYQRAEVTTSETQPDRILSRIDDLSSRPEWLKESEPFRVENGYVISTGQTTIPGDNRVEAGYRIAENNAKAAIAGAIESRLDTVFQNAEEGTAIDTTQARYIGAEATNFTTSSLRTDRRYWERVATTSDGGKRTTQYKVFATVKMPESDFRTAVLDAIRKRQGKGGLSQDFAQKVNEHWDRFVNARQPSSTSEGKAE